MRILALDLGERRVGVAVSDPDGIMAHPLVQFEPKGRGDLVARVVRLVAEQGAQRVVVGLPLLHDGRRGEQARRAEAVAAALAGALEAPVVLWDERFSTVEAEAALRGAHLTADRRKARRDKVAAAFILQSYLDAGCPASPPPEAAGC
ncbi:MAG: Holliday junction resolvase RuvX [Acidobacteria bacterium]|nr:Holliday junction resolvase RuvX [Planctomycetota bacterium]MBE3134388.1 Holliday junction resolvase RuvX [Acidobacteriota bacterium]